MIKNNIPRVQRFNTQAGITLPGGYRSPKESPSIGQPSIGATGTSNDKYVLQIIGGNLSSNSVLGIKYNPGAILSAAYNPDITTSFADGFGNAYLFVNGALSQNKVLVWNKDPANPYFLTSGRRLGSSIIEKLSYNNIAYNFFIPNFL